MGVAMPRRLPSEECLCIVDAGGCRKLKANWYMTLVADRQKTDVIRIGIDEVGRGCVWGPIVVTGVAVLNGWRLEGIRDSKTIKNENTRNALASEIAHNCVWATAHFHATSLNKLCAEWREGMERPMTAALRACFEKVEAKLVEELRLAFPDRQIEVICDGDDWPDAVFPTHSRKSIVKADATEYEVSAASILAKVTRDQWVREQVKLDPTLNRYDLVASKGYGTPSHTKALRMHGLHPHHRKQACTTLLAG